MTCRLSTILLVVGPVVRRRAARGSVAECVVCGRRNHVMACSRPSDYLCGNCEHPYRRGNLPETSLSTGSRLYDTWTEFCAGLGLEPALHEDAHIIALQIAPTLHDEAASIRTASVFRQLVDAVGVEAAADRLAGIIGRTVVALQPEALQQLLGWMNATERKLLIMSSLPVLEAGAVLALTMAAAPTYGRTLSPPLQRLLHKLHHEAVSLPAAQRPRAERAFRSLALYLLETWSADVVDPVSHRYEQMFERVENARRSPVAPEPARIVKIALETGAIGNMVWRAVAALTPDEAGMLELLELIRGAPPDTRAAALIIEHVATPTRLSILLQADPIDREMVDRFVAALGMMAARPLIDELIAATHRGQRRAIMDMLVTLGPGIAQFLAEQLGDPRWYVVRNMTVLLREAGCDLERVDLDRLMAHPDGRVRREVVQLQLGSGKTHDFALLQALTDEDKHVLRSGLQAARTRLPPPAAAALATRVTDSTFPPEFRVMALHLLGRTTVPESLDALLAFADGGKTLLRRPRLAPKSPEMLAALGGLARSWSRDRRAAPLLDLARRSGDEQILTALRTGGTSS
jgi:hypothetical protein